MRENTKIVLYIVLLTLVVLDLINTSFIRYAQHKFDLGNTFHLRDDVRELYYAERKAHGFSRGMMKTVANS